MALDYQFKPIAAWPKPFTTRRIEAKFTSSATGKRTPLATTLRDLERELRFLGGRNVRIQVALKESDIRLDGQIRATARLPEHPGVILAFDDREGSMSFAQDRYTHWHDNLRSIALTLEALRTVDRYGVTEHGEQYQGFRALPSASDTAMQARSAREKAAATILEHSDYATNVTDILANPDLAKSVYRDALKRTHPDAVGNDDSFNAVRQAWEILEGAK